MSTFNFSHISKNEQQPMVFEEKMGVFGWQASVQKPFCWQFWPLFTLAYQLCPSDQVINFSASGANFMSVVSQSKYSSPNLAQFFVRSKYTILSMGGILALRSSIRCGATELQLVHIQTSVIFLNVCRQTPTDDQKSTNSQLVYPVILKNRLMEDWPHMNYN